MENIAVYIAPRFFEEELAKEIAHYNLPLLERRGRLFAVKAKAQPLVWAQNTWTEAFFLPIESVGDGAKKLKAIQRNWHAHPTDCFRRAKLIEEKLPPMRFRPQVFGEPAPSSALGAWTLWDANTILASAKTSSPYADGECLFDENKTDPPSRAYLKLWEIFTLADTFPKKGDLSIDLGACPGGWTWVMASLGAEVLAIDKSELAPHVHIMDGVEFQKGSGFALEPQDFTHTDWLLSDMICYPERLYTLTQKWLKVAPPKNIVFTVKLQGDDDFNVLKSFMEIENSSLLHLSCNKHELTWIYGEINLNFQKRLTLPR